MYHCNVVAIGCIGSINVPLICHNHQGKSERIRKNSRAINASSGNVLHFKRFSRNASSIFCGKNIENNKIKNELFLSTYFQMS